jgi:hypothetical protein
MIGAAGVKRCLANRTSVATIQIFVDAERAFAIATKNGLCLKFGPWPNSRNMVNAFVVAVNAGVKGVTALKPDANQVALGIIMGALGTFVHLNAVTNDGWLLGHV